MKPTSSGTPLPGLAAISLDLETTSLDSKTARIVQIGAVRLRADLDGKPSHFASNVNPGVPIPAATSAIHGLNDHDVVDAPPLASLIDALDSFVDGAVIVGHHIAYDLAVLEAEYARTNHTWPRLRALDTAILARIALPPLPHYDLDGVADRLGIAIEGRHTAMGDAVATAKIFEALIPLLREKGIRTLAEAETASQQLAERTPSGVKAPELPTAGRSETVLQKLDSFPYRHRVRDVMSAPAATAAGTATVQQAIARLIDDGISSLFVDGGDHGVGIVTERDLLRALDRGGPDALTQPLADIMSAPVHTVSQDAFIYRAIGRMERIGVRHLAVRDKDNNIVGAVTTRNLLRHRATTAIMLGDEIDQADDTATLARAWARIPHMAQSLVDEDVDPRTIAAVISAEICAITRRAAIIAEAQMEAEGKGRAPVPYALLVLGSGGRGESLLAADQDNAIVYQSGNRGGSEDVWFEALGVKVSDILDAVGIPYCKGGVMARNAAWRKSVAAWTETIDGWIRRQRPEDLLNVDIFYDGVCVHGDVALAESIWRHAYEIGATAPDFLVALTGVVADWQSPVKLLGGLRTDERGRLDLKKLGLLPIFTTARILSIRHGVLRRSTPERLQGVLDKGIGSPNDIAGILEAHKTFLGTMLRQQLSDTKSGIPLSPRVQISTLGARAKRRLKAAISYVETAISIAREGRI